MGEIEAKRAYEVFDIPEAAHLPVLQEASSGNPWTPEAADSPGVRIDEDIYAEGILSADPREKQDRHDLLLDGRMERYLQNLDLGQAKWDLVLAETDFYRHPDEIGFDDGVNHNRNIDDSLRAGDGDLIFLDLDRYEVHMVEVKPHEGYARDNSSPEVPDPDIDQWTEDVDLDSYELPSIPDCRAKSEDVGGNAVKKKTANWREAWESVIGELENDWSIFRPEFVYGSSVLDTSNLAGNPEYALPPHYDQESGYVLASEEGYRKAESSRDLEVLNQFFFRNGIEELTEGERPEMERKNIF